MNFEDTFRKKKKQHTNIFSILINLKNVCFLKKVFEDMIFSSFQIFSLSLLSKDFFLWKWIVINEAIPACYRFFWHSSLVLSPLCTHLIYRQCVEINYLRNFNFFSQFQWNAIQELSWRDGQVDTCADNWINLDFFRNQARSRNLGGY